MLARARLNDAPPSIAVAADKHASLALGVSGEQGAVAIAFDHS
jgi:hypothetical protein